MMQELCMYCFGQDGSPIDKAHLFPKSIGGRVRYTHCCKACNNHIGHTIEGEVKKCVFFATGIERTGLQSKGDAYRDIKRIENSETGHPMKFRGDDLIAKRRLDENGLATGEEEFVEERTLDYVRRKFPNWEEKVRRELQDGKDEIRLPGEKLVRRRSGGEIPILLQGDISFPYGLLAKISYEGMYLAGVWSEALLGRFVDETFEVYLYPDQKRRITVSPQFRNRARSYRNDLLGGSVDYSALDYRHFHRLDFRVTSHGTLYCLVVFFGILPFLVALGKCAESDIVDPTLLGKRIVFPFAGSILQDDEYPPEFAEHRRRDDAFADGIWQYYSERRVGKL